MKKSLYFAIFAVFAFFTPIFATTMCAINDSVVVILDPSITGTAGGALDIDTGTWYATFSYGKIYGISNCVNSKCKCKITHPVASYWIDDGRSYGSDAACQKDCPIDCGYDTKTNKTFRLKLFNLSEQQ